MSKFNTLFKQILEEVETWNDKPNPPGGNNYKFTDAGNIGGNNCNFSNPGNMTGSDGTEPGDANAGNMTGSDGSESSTTTATEAVATAKSGIPYYKVKKYDEIATCIDPDTGLECGGEAGAGGEGAAVGEEKEEIEECEGACAAPAGMGTVNVMGPDPSRPSIADTTTKSGDFDYTKSSNDAGVTTKDVKQIYSPSLNKAPKAQKQAKQSYPLFSRFKK